MKSHLGFVFMMLVLVSANTLSDVLFLGKQPSYHGKVLHVESGDTLRVQAVNNIAIVRLYGVDAPEFGQAFARESWKSLKAKLGDKHVSVRVVGKDCHGNELAYVYLNQINLSEYQLKSGWVWAVQTENKGQAQLLHMQNKAMERRLGLWAKKAISPWQWRSQQGQSDQNRC